MKEKIEQWARDKGIDKPEGVQRQFLKLVEEFGEYELALQEDDDEKYRDAVGDIQVVGIIMAMQLGENLKLLSSFNDDTYPAVYLGKIAEALAKNTPVFLPLQQFVSCIRQNAIDWQGANPDICLEEVYAIISKRKGKTENGVFIKE